MTAFDSMYSDAFSLFNESFAAGVTYTSGSESLTVDAMDAQISNDEQLEFNANMISEGKVFLILKASLIISGSTIEPTRTDTIENASGVWEIISFADLPDYETDVNEDYWRIRTIKQS